MARCPRLAAAGSPGTSSVSTKATKVMPMPSSTSAARRRPRNLTKGRDSSPSCHPGKSCLLAAGAGDVNRPGRVVVGARDALGRNHDLPRLDQWEERTIGVELPLDLLKEMPFRVKSLGKPRFTVGFEMPDAASSALALVRSNWASSAGVSAPRNMLGTTPGVWIAPAPASCTYDA